MESFAPVLAPQPILGYLVKKNTTGLYSPVVESSTTNIIYFKHTLSKTHSRKHIQVSKHMKIRHVAHDYLEKKKSQHV
jgi:hypothetical protein